MKVILKKDYFNELNKEYEVYKIEDNKIYLNKNRWVGTNLVEKYIEEGENMKIKIIDILNKIANGEEVPKKIMYKGATWEYKEDEKDYSNKEWNEWLFDVYLITEILNDFIEILEITITNKPKKIEKLKKVKIISGMLDNEIQYIEEYKLEDVGDKINEIIDYINKD